MNGRAFTTATAVMSLAAGLVASAIAADGPRRSASTAPAHAAVKAALAELEEDLKMFARRERLGQTWVEADGAVYGAKPDKLGPIGGGEGYQRIVTRGDFTVRTLDELLAALTKAKPGQVVFVPGRAEIDCTERVHIEKLVIEVPAGVTLAGDRGHEGSRGGMIRSDTFATRPLIRADGKGIRVTGLRIRGPDPNPRLAHHRRSFAQGRGHKYYYKFPVSDGIQTAHDELEVDNCEIAGFSHAAIYLRRGKGHRVHHSYIHHNQYNGLGYGVCHDTAFSRIEFNLFNYNRHSIAGTGRPGSGYEAANNIEIRHSLSHCFDMHGGRDRKDGTNVAGTWIKVHHNTFWCPRPAVVIRGRPQDKAEVHHNWFCHPSPERAVRSGGNTEVRDNLCRPRPARRATPARPAEAPRTGSGTPP